jgi:hypothetical protein
MSATVNRFIRVPPAHHSIYSLWHGFKDRRHLFLRRASSAKHRRASLVAVDAPDRLIEGVTMTYCNLDEIERRYQHKIVGHNDARLPATRRVHTSEKRAVAKAGYALRAKRAMHFCETAQQGQMCTSIGRCRVAV